jgi:hypothetical protein
MRVAFEFNKRALDKSEPEANLSSFAQGEVCRDGSSLLAHFFCWHHLVTAPTFGQSERLPALTADILLAHRQRR